jgi:hypothetical protein
MVLLQYRMFGVHLLARDPGIGCSPTALTSLQNHSPEVHRQD